MIDHILMNKTIKSQPKGKIALELQTETTSIKRHLKSIDQINLSKNYENSTNISKVVKLIEDNTLDNIRDENSSKVMENIRRKLAILTVTTHNNGINSEIMFFNK